MTLSTQLSGLGYICWQIRKESFFSKSSLVFIDRTTWVILAVLYDQNIYIYICSTIAFETVNWNFPNCWVTMKSFDWTSGCLDCALKTSQISWSQTLNKWSTYLHLNSLGCKCWYSKYTTFIINWVSVKVNQFRGILGILPSLRQIFLHEN